MMGTLDSTSAWYSLIMPLFTWTHAQLSAWCRSHQGALPLLQTSGTSCAPQLRSQAVLTLRQDSKPLMSFSMGDTSASGPFFTCTHPALQQTHDMALEPNIAAHLLDEGDGSQVEVVRRSLAQDRLLVDGGRREGGVLSQLGGAPEEGQALVVVQPPHAMRACWLQPAQRALLDSAPAGRHAASTADCW